LNKKKVIVTCPNKNCQQKLRLPKINKVLRVSCPKCHATFRYKFPSIIDKLTPGEQAEEELQYNISGLLTEFDKALEDEIKAVKTRGGDRTLALKDGKFVREIAGGRVYQFNLERKVPVADETPAQIEIRGRNYGASIVRFLEFKLEVRITDFEGDQIPFAFLKIDATYVLRKLKEALYSLRYNPKNVNLALKVFNHIPPKSSARKPLFTLMDKNRQEPDPYQAKAIEMCLGSEVSFIHGPPGTGKTRTLVNVVNDLAHNGKKVLISSHTNIACDNVIEHFIEFSHEKTVKNLLNEGRIIRIGTPVLENDKIKDLTIEAIYERLSGKLVKEREKLITLANSLIQKNKKYYEYKQILLECKNLAESIARCKENISASKEAIEQHILEENRLSQSIREKEQLLSIAEKRNSIINFFKETRPKHIRLTITNLKNERMRETRSRLEEEKRLKFLLSELEKLNSSFTKKFEGLPEEINIDEIENVLKETESALKEVKLRIADVDDRISKLNEGVLNNAKVIVSTLAKTFTDPVLMNRKFDAVIIDEASIAPLPMLFYVCSLAKEKVLIFGDPKQLSPIQLADTSIAKRWLKKDIFQEADAIKEQEDEPRIWPLNFQYRMHEEIFNIVNNRFYEGKLRNRRKQIDDESNKYDRLIPKSEHRVVIIDTSNANACMSTEKIGSKRRSRYNLYHVQILEKLLHDLIDLNCIRQENIGIITPYRSQASFMREMLLESGFEKVDVGAVHSFQGVEKEYIIFDLVEAPFGRRIGILVNDKHNRYLGKDPSENEAMRLLTVAFSRPKEKLLIISHNKHILSNLPESSVLRRIIVDLIMRNAVIDGSSLVPYYIPKEDFPDSALFSLDELLEKEAVFNQRSFYPHFIRDIKRAKKEVIIISGYMSRNRVEKLMPYFANVLSRGVKVKIFTKPPREQMSKEQELEELHYILNNMGIEVYQHYGTHEKLVAIDSHIMYTGSLNVLSFNHSSKEMMIRSDSKSKLQKVLSVLAKNHPQLRDCFIKNGYVVPEEVVDLTPNRFQSVWESVRPKTKKLPKNKEEAKEYYRSVFKKLRWIIADDKRIPYLAVLFNSTIEALLNEPPATRQQLLSLPEFIRNSTNIRGYESIILKILDEYKKVDC